MRAKTKTPFDVEKFFKLHWIAFDKLSKELATNYNVPAQSLINRTFANIGESRFVGADDRWEQVTAFQGGFE